MHGAGGLWGTLAVHFFKKDGIFVTGSSAAAMGLAWNVIGLIAIISWTGILSFVMFYALKKVKMLRVEASMEFSGMQQTNLLVKYVVSCLFDLRFRHIDRLVCPHMGSDSNPQLSFISF